MIKYEEAEKLANEDFIGSYDILDAWVKAGLVEPKKLSALEEAREMFDEMKTDVEFRDWDRIRGMVNFYEKAVEEAMQIDDIIIDWLKNIYEDNKDTGFFAGKYAKRLLDHFGVEL